MGEPTWRVLGLADRTPETSYTIGIDSITGTADRARRASEAGYKRLKVKLGGEADLERLEAIRAVCNLPLRVDANEGWDVAEARELLPALVGLGVELIEQPFPAGEREAFRELRAVGSGIPLVVDEGCHTLRDVADVAGYADGVNRRHGDLQRRPHAHARGDVHDRARLDATPRRSSWASRSRHDGHVGRGEGAPDDRYGESVEATPARSSSSAGDALGDDPFALEAIEARCGARGGSVVGCCAVECALHDWSASSSGSRPGACSGSPSARRETSYTIGIDSVEGTADRARRAAEAGYRRLKVKVGGAADLERLEAIRAVCDLPLRVDANEGWDARDGARAAAGAGRARRRADRAAVPGRRARRVPRAARAAAAASRWSSTRAVTRLRDVADVATYADGVNIKLAKTRRHPRGRAHGARGARARARRHARLHDRELARHRGGGRSSRRSATSSTSTATC